MKRRRSRRRSRVFRRRRNRAVIGKVLLWLLVIPVAIGGYFLAQYMFTHDSGKPTVAPPADGTVTTTTGDPSVPTSPTPDSAPSVTDEKAALSQLRAIYLPHGLLQAPDAWEETLTAAAAAGYNAVVTDVKDADGQVWYTTASALAATARSVQEDAISLEALVALRETLQEQYGLTLIPRLFAFRDNTAPRYLESARVSVQGDSGSVWYDDNPSEGGRRWLNPYAADARGYILELAGELHESGFSLLMLDGVQFPEQESRAYYGDAEQTAMPRGELLAGFAAQMSATVGENGWIITATGLATVGEKTTAYGANPATFGTAAIAPWSVPADFGAKLKVGEEKVSSPAAHPYEAVTLLFSQLKARLALMEDAPLPVPWLQAEDYTAAEIAEEITALREQFGESAPYILYHPDGAYAF